MTDSPTVDHAANQPAVASPQAIEPVRSAWAGAATVRAWDVAADATTGAVNPMPAVITAAAITAVIFRINVPLTLADSCPITGTDPDAPLDQNRTFNLPHPPR